MKSVWLVHYGATVEGVFKSEAKAKRFITLQKSSYKDWTDFWSYTHWVVE